MPCLSLPTEVLGLQHSCGHVNVEVDGIGFHLFSWGVYRMRVYRRYRCDHGHEWIVATHSEKAEVEGDLFCPAGHDAVTCSEEMPADEVQVLIRPAARIVDRVTGNVALAGRYYLVLLDQGDSEICASSNDLSWDDAVKLATLFKGKDTPRALEWWRRKGL
jgi:hypothetical protein